MKSALERRIRRKFRIRKRVFGTATKPRISVSRSLKHIYVQAIDDLAGKSIIGLSTVKLIKQRSGEKLTKSQLSFELGKTFGEILLSRGYSSGVFDRSGYKYHGRVKAVCEGLRQAGIRI